MSELYELLGKLEDNTIDAAELEYLLDVIVSNGIIWTLSVAQRDNLMRFNIRHRVGSRIY